MWTLEFWQDAGERALSTAAEVFLACATVASATPSIEEVPWGHCGSVALVAAGFSLLKSIISTRRGDPTSASLLKSKKNPAA